MIRGVIFDLDGVLVTTDELHFLGWKYVADREGIYFDREINKFQRGVSRMESLEVLLRKSTKKYTPEEKDQLCLIKNEHYRNMLEKLTYENTLPGARDMLRALRAKGIKTSIGSSSKNTPLIMKVVGLAGEVDKVADGNDIKRSKPFPDVFLIAAERLGFKPEECMVVEDAVAGVEAAHAAGMPVFGIGDKESLAGADVPFMAPDLAHVTADELVAAGNAQLKDKGTCGGCSCCGGN